MSCNKPFLMRRKDGTMVPVPCGWCLQCRIDKRNEWTLRLSHEVAKSGGAFVTLTYDDANLPDDCGLHKDHVQKFLKRLRKHLDCKIKYYAVGEYGSKGSPITGLHRPHYHLIVTGISPLRLAPLVSKSWTLGITKTLGAERGSIRYVLKYIDKQIHGVDALKAEYGDLQPPFALMSQGIGLDWMINNQDSIEFFLGVPYDGRIVPVPRYYRNLLGVGTSGYSMSADKRRVVLQYMTDHNCSLIVALNALGEANERHLLASEQLHN